MNPRSAPSPGVYWSVFVALMLLLGVTLIGDQFDLGIGNLILAIGISVAKTLLIALFFMHLRYAVPTVRIVAMASLLWLAVSAALTMADFTMRGWHEPGSGWLADEQRTNGYDRVSP